MGGRPAPASLVGPAVALGPLSARFIGGEPLLRPDFAALYLLARRLGMEVLLFSDASLITLQVASEPGKSWMEKSACGVC